MRFRLLFLFAALSVTACGPSTGEQSSASVTGCTDPSIQGSIVVMAASSMVNVFTDVQKDFLKSQPCVTDVTYSYGSSATLATQIVNGSPADVFVSASQATMNTAKNAGKTLNDTLFARNIGEIMVSSASKFAGRITDVASLSDAVNAGIKVGLCVASAPCGSLSNVILNNVGTTRGEIADTESPSMEDLVTKIQIGELDAGIVYHSDCQYAQLRGLATCVAIASAVNSANGYYVAALTNRPIVQRYVDYINGSDFKATLQMKFGFLAP